MDSGRLETMSSGAMHLDTVRALHQTVVSLRTALEVSKNELKDLKERYQQHSNCLEYADVIEKLALENHILRRKIIDSDVQERDSNPNIKLEVTYVPESGNVEEYTESEVIIKTATTDVNSATEESSQDPENNNTTDYLKPDSYQEGDKADESSSNFSEDKDNYSVNESKQEEEESQSHAINLSAEFTPQESGTDEHTDVDDPDSQVASYQKEHTNEFQYPNFKTKLELLSKFDVRIKVRTLKEGSIISSTTSDTDSTFEENKDKDTEKPNTKGAKDAKPNFDEKKLHSSNSENFNHSVNLKTVSSENINMAVPNEAEAKTKTDKFDVQVRITSEENLVVKETVDRCRKRDTLNLDVDDLSLRSLSEGDNSVFSETGVTPVDPSAIDDRLEQDNVSENESEEVDDIELIFTTDESKDMSNLQEDLVSIREGEPWVPSSASTHSTPVLIKFHTLDPDYQPRGHDPQHAPARQISESSLRMKRVSLPSDKEIRHVAFNGKSTSTSLDLPGRSILKSCENKSDITLYKRSPNTSTRRLDSVDSLTCEYNRGLSFDNTKSSSFELGSSMDILHREESVDSFHKGSRFGHRFSVFAETDISKCGISEDDLVGNLNVRRNTCPNPFQYRAGGRMMPRGAVRGAVRARGARGAGAGGAGAGATAGAGVRREAGAQTELCALPAWSSDGHLAYKAPPLLTYPASNQPVRLTVPEPRQTVQHRDRDLLSDIGFTSMVPELSRSADPLWAGRRAPHVSQPAAESALSTNTSKYISRGSFRSPLLSVDRGSDWVTQPVYMPTKRVDYRLWRSSLPDVRRDDTEELLHEADMYLRRSTDNIPQQSEAESYVGTGTPYIPAEPRQLRLGHTVKLIAPNGRIAVGRVRYVGIAGCTAANSSVVVGAEFLHQQYPGLAKNDGTYLTRRYFLAQSNHTALFVPFSKVVMAWAN